jgi:membrane-bound ClpP family serine protease
MAGEPHPSDGYRASPRPNPIPLWAGLSLVVSGLVLIVVETPNLLFFFGVGLLVLGVYALVKRRSAAPRTQP